MKIDHGQFCRRPPSRLVRDSSAVRRLFVRLAGAVGRQSTLHKENSGFAPPTLGRHISTVRGYRTLFSIRNQRGSQLYFHIAMYMLKEKGGHFFCCPK